MKYFIYCRKSTEAEDRQALSIESQLSSLRKAFGANPDVEIAHVYEEAFSAKAPGRPLFEEMLSRIERAEAAGIVAWAPDRLARNSIDGGRLIYLLDRGVLRDLKFATSTFENTSQGKFMLQIMFGQSKYYSDALSENVRRGNRTKIEKGWRPNSAPLGYRNDPTTKTIVPDPTHFPLIRRIFDLILTGAANPRQIASIARDQWGFRTPIRKRSGGRPLARSTIYRILENPFYAGLIRWGGELFPGKHIPVISIAEFEQVRAILRRAAQPRSKRYTFPYTGLIRCGACGLSVTAEHKINRLGRRYVYYHCSRQRPGGCPEPYLEVRALEQQLVDFLRTISLPPAIHGWAMKQLAGHEHDRRVYEEARERSLMATRNDMEAQLRELTALRLRRLLSDEEFSAEREKRRHELMRLDQAIEQAAKPTQERRGFLKDVMAFGQEAAEWFASGDNRLKRLIVTATCSNITLTRKMLRIEAAKPFVSLRDFASSLPPNPSMFEHAGNGLTAGRNGYLDMCCPG
ncbi:MAG TPA: recombinase family protein [Beijerinckiaceae bacterium]|jgi:DNA invertase Pin-like site-specific DNA recombinase